MRELFTTTLGRFRLVAILEGLSFLLLLGIAMPLKYIWGQPGMVQSVGMIHGLLVVLYVMGAFQMRSVLGWSWGQVALALFLSLLPFGTFYVTGKMMGDAKNSSPGR